MMARPIPAALTTGACAFLLFTHAIAGPSAPEPPRGLELRQKILQSVPAFAPNRILVRFKDGVTRSRIDAAHRRHGGVGNGNIPGIDVQLVQVPPGQVRQALRRYRADPDVAFAEEDFYRVVYIPDEGDDPGPDAGGTIAGRDYFTEQWGLHNTGQQHTTFDLLGAPLLVNGTADADIDAPAAWDVTQGLPSVKIAVLDTGIDCDSIEHAGKCVEEVSFVATWSENGASVDDYVGHGTHVAGIAAANTDNAIGIAAIGWQSSLGNLKTCFAYQLDLLPPLGIYVTVGVCPVSASAAAITHAADNGYHVINMSYATDQLDGSGNPSGVPAQPNAETAAINYAWNQGAVLVAAAGNDNSTTPVYPAAHADVIAVAATNHFDDRASFSSFSQPGAHWVSLMAPGEDILSTAPVSSCAFLANELGYPFDPLAEGCMTWQSGTSMASPHVAGAAALVWAELFPGQAPAGCVSAGGVPCNQVIRSHLEHGADVNGAGTQNFLAWSEHGRLNVFGALSVSDLDLDGIPDGEDLDTDGDGLADVLETSAGINTNPSDPDSDADGLDDGAEVNYSTPPVDVYTAGQDTNPLVADTDGDTHLDGAEVDAGSDPLDAASVPAPGC